MVSQAPDPGIPLEQAAEAAAAKDLSQPAAEPSKGSSVIRGREIQKVGPGIICCS